MGIIFMFFIIELLLVGVSFNDFISISLFNEFLHFKRNFIYLLYRTFSVIMFIIVLVCGIISLISDIDLLMVLLILTSIHFLVFVITIIICHFIGKTNYYKTLDKYILYYIEDNKYLKGEELVTFIIKSLAVDYDLMYKHSDIRKSLKKYNDKGTEKLW